MNLYYQQLGSWQAFIILHGLFGSSDNWKTIGNYLSNYFEVYLIDLRNHGRSPHSTEFSYESMANDIHEFILQKKLRHVILMGHSMGGKVAMKYALQESNKLDKLVVVDIAPKYYPPHHQKYLDAFDSLDLRTVSSRKEVEEHFAHRVSDMGERLLLLKNLYWDEHDCLAWRVNIDAISNNMKELCEGQDCSDIFSKPTFFIKGEKSKYVTTADEVLIKKLFPNYQLKTISNAGHWIHAEKPKEFMEAVLDLGLI